MERLVRLIDENKELIAKWPKIQPLFIILF